MTHSDFLILGGGIIGMMSAWQLAEAGHTVALVERGQCGREASWAGGGILSPLYPWRYDDPVNDLAEWSMRRYPLLVRQLAQTTGIDPEYRRKGLLYLQEDDESPAQAWAQRRQRTLQRVSGAAIHALEPQLAAGFRDGLWMPDLASVRNPRLCQAL
ncbi:glycine oxidase ThiO, partial [Vibrio agarivorans]